MRWRLVTNGEKWKIQRSHLGLFWCDCEQFGLCTGDMVTYYDTEAAGRAKLNEFISKDDFCRLPWRKA